MRIRRHVFGLAMAIVLGIAGNAEPTSSSPPDVAIAVSPGVVVLPLGARSQLGFKFGPVDGVMGGVKDGPNQYRFFGSGQSLNTSACPGTPGVQGIFVFTSNLGVSPPSFTTDCSARLQPSGPLVETGIVGAYDRNYLGGGPAMQITHPDGRRGVLLVYHSEVQWYDDGPCATGSTLCFYGTLGMAFSSDDGATFQKLGLIVQAHISRATAHTPPFLGGNVPIGNGPFVLGDAAGNVVDPRTADPSQTYLYVLYVDSQEDLGAADACAPSKACLAVARAPLSAVIEAAFAGGGTTLSGLFRKYFNGGFEEPAAPPDPNGTLPTNTAGRYTPLLKNAFSPSAIYDAVAGQVILASVASKQIQLRVSRNLLDWSQPAVATVAEAAPFAEVRYPSLIGDLDANVAGGAPWLFYSREPPDGTWPQTEFMVTTLQVQSAQPVVPVTTSLVSAVLPSSRSAQVGRSAMAFATVINAGAGPATGCRIAPMTNIPATFTYHTTHPATNQVIGAPNPPVDIPAGASQSYVFAITPTGSLPPTDVQLSFHCENTNQAPVLTGLNTILLSASETPVPDIVAVAGTVDHDGIVTIPGPSGTGVFVVATANLGASGTVTVSAHTGHATLPVTILLCETDPRTGQCASALGPGGTTEADAKPTQSLGMCVMANGTVPFEPATSRIFVHFKEPGTVTRGSTSVAVRTR